MRLRFWWPKGERSFSRSSGRWLPRRCKRVFRDKAYVLLRDALVEFGKTAISLVVTRMRQHLAAIKPQKKMLMLELMYFPDELIDVAEFNAPVKNAVGKAEMQMAKQLIERMTAEWKPEEYTDLYHDR
jgi:DNA end-binding protein Ku